MREKLMALIDEADKICDSYFRCDECPYRAEYGRNCINELIADHLIANSVTITPAVPGAKMGHDMAEVCYRNGEEAMREKVIDYLRAQKGVTMGVIRSTIGDIIEKVRKL